MSDKNKQSKIFLKRLTTKGLKKKVYDFDDIEIVDNKISVANIEHYKDLEDFERDYKECLIENKYNHAYFNIMTMYIYTNYDDRKYYNFKIPHVGRYGKIYKRMEDLILSNNTQCQYIKDSYISYYYHIMRLKENLKNEHRRDILKNIVCDDVTYIIMAFDNYDYAHFNIDNILSFPDFLNTL